MKIKDPLKIYSNVLFADKYSLLLTKPENLTKTDFTLLLTYSIALIRTYTIDTSFTSYVRLAYSIILNYSLNTNDYEPLLDFSANFGFFPIVGSLSKHLEKSSNVKNLAIIEYLSSKFAYGDVIETKEQNIVRHEFGRNESIDACLIAPTSFGKSKLIFEHIKENTSKNDKVAIIVPSKSLIMQTYRSIRSLRNGYKIVLHEDMYNNDNRMVAVLTQERALRLLEANDELYFNVVYIDEAHKMLENSYRAVLLTRFIKLNRIRSIDSRFLYFSPVLASSDSIIVDQTDRIFQYKIHYNLKEPQYIEYGIDKKIRMYDIYNDKFYSLNESSDPFDFIKQNMGQKNFLYLNTPRKIESFCRDLIGKLTQIECNSEINELLINLEKYVHEDYFMLSTVKFGFVYLHAKMPDLLKEYIEFKFKKVENLNSLIANNVILEGINLPIDTLFVLSGWKLSATNLINLIGRVNRLDSVFGSSGTLKKLIPKIYFVNTEEYNQKRSTFERRIRSIRNFGDKDEINNPTLKNYVTKNPDKIEERNKRLEDELLYFANVNSSYDQIRRNIIVFGLGEFYKNTSELAFELEQKILHLRTEPDFFNEHFLDKLKKVLLDVDETYIIDYELKRLRNSAAIEYYKDFFNSRHLSLKENLVKQLSRINYIASSSSPQMYFGDSFGEVRHKSSQYESGKPVYVDLSKKSNSERVTLALVKLKMEDDFVSYKLITLFHFLYTLGLLSEEEFFRIKYGTTNHDEIELIKYGFSLGIVKKLINDKQVENIIRDENNNLVANLDFTNYCEGLDDFTKFEIEKYIELNKLN